MEWVPRGSLSLLLDDSTLNLMWDEPLLRLATDVARGIEYLHSCRYFDEASEEFKECILHRDLKPDNVLVTDFLRGKVTDFGASRAKSMEDRAMTAVGTPIFCAPEITRGDVYDESVDVYSFGLLLINMAVQGGITEFLSERYTSEFYKKKPPTVMRLMRVMVEDSWRPMDDIERKIPGCPPLINSMISNCIDASPQKRPSFAKIVHDLQEACADEISLGSYSRWIVGGDPLSLTSSPSLVEDLSRISMNNRLSRISLHSRLSHTHHDNGATYSLQPSSTMTTHIDSGGHSDNNNNNSNIHRSSSSHRSNSIMSNPLFNGLKSKKDNLVIKNTSSPSNTVNDDNGTNV
eukprot:CAMPEP_0114330796 /NCGR_PEP_ID=MMETSP0101-20121206/1989_1 /TAXON_ID=38822 ORGANISM="Pteridomonas danica, Strain PT" /NCGR_SAMPLE_ID=MMETSP0101 /ASSEMBLY_ACC=CAM_ASM_000211 /LENGTH=347 /DNA_ID=CAMNT_0001460925 /DNA_START=179 /DNA_END=1222 /DNA_ORIENTATION=+